MTVASLLLANAAFVLACVLLLWLICLGLHDVTPMDSFWAIGLFLVGVVTALQAAGAADRKLALVALSGIWGLRLGLYLFWRWRQHGPDRRYVRLLEKSEAAGMSWARASLVKVFLTQAPMLWLVALPVQLGQVDAEPARLGPLAFAGIALAVLGIVFESVGDFQLSRFRADPANAGKVLDRGLWRYTRHPNYFGDACVWWGLYLIAAETATGLWALPGPVLLTWTLMKWSGAPTLERRLAKTRPDYAAYIQRTSGFFPLPPKA
jgi:steroid 5-alpha reductase family enzyme